MTLDPRTNDRSQLEGMVLPELQRIAHSLGVSGAQRLRKGDLISAIVATASADGAGSPDEARAASGSAPATVAADPAPDGPATTSEPAASDAEAGNGKADGALGTDAAMATVEPGLGNGEAADPEAEEGPSGNRRGKVRSHWPVATSHKLRASGAFSFSKSLRTGRISSRTDL